MRLCIVNPTVLFQRAVLVEREFDSAVNALGLAGGEVSEFREKVKELARTTSLSTLDAIDVLWERHRQGLAERNEGDEW